ADRLGFAIRSGSVQRSATPEHGFLDLLGDHRPDFAEVFAHGFDLQYGAKEKFEVAFKVTRQLPGLGGVEACTDEVVDVDFWILLAVTVHATVALFHPVWVPRNFVVDELPTVVLEIDALG